MAQLGTNRAPGGRTRETMHTTNAVLCQHVMRPELWGEESASPYCLQVLLGEMIANKKAQESVDMHEGTRCVMDNSEGNDDGNYASTSV